MPYDLMLIAASPRATGVNYRILIPKDGVPTEYMRFAEKLHSFEVNVDTSDHSQQTKIYEEDDNFLVGWMLGAESCVSGVLASGVGQPMNLVAVGRLVRQLSARKNYEWVMLGWRGEALSSDEGRELISMLKAYSVEFGKYIECRTDWEGSGILVPHQMVSQWLVDMRTVFNRFIGGREKYSEDNSQYASNDDQMKGKNPYDKKNFFAAATWILVIIVCIVIIMLIGDIRNGLLSMKGG